MMAIGGGLAAGAAIFHGYLYTGFTMQSYQSIEFWKIVGFEGSLCWEELFRGPCNTGG